VAFRAKTYENRKEEKKLQVSGDQAEFKKLVAGDKEITDTFLKAISDALKK
jgi:hypothetical protein